MSKLTSHKRRAFVARVSSLLDQVPRSAVDGLLTARGRREWAQARERFEAELSRAGLELPPDGAPRAIDIAALKGRNLRAVVGPPESDPFRNERNAQFHRETKMRALAKGGYVPELHILPEDLAQEAWPKERCRFHGVSAHRASAKGHSYCYYDRSAIAQYSTDEHTQRWQERLDEAKSAKAAKQNLHKEAESRRLEFARRKKDGTLITRQEIIARGWRVPATPDFVQALGRGYVRYYYRLPIEVIPVRRRGARREESSAAE